MKERTTVSSTVLPFQSGKIDAKTLNAAMDAGTWQTTSKGGEGSAKYLVRSPTVPIWAYADVVCTHFLLYYLFSSSNVCAGVVLSSTWADTAYVPCV